MAMKAKTDQKLRDDKDELQKVMLGKQSIKSSITKMTPEEQKVKLE